MRLLTHAQIMRLYRELYGNFTTRFFNRIIEQDQREPKQLAYTVALWKEKYDRDQRRTD